MRDLAARLLSILALPSVSLAAGCPWDAEWVDLDTPSDACTARGKGDKPFKLVFSDEFELGGRSLRDGDDARWTGIDSWPGGNAQVSYYNSSLPVTHGGMLHMPVVKSFVPPRKGTKPGEEGIDLKGTEKYYQTAMIQTWNKFCFSQSGIVEMKARLPGEATMPGLWPAFWIMGNLGRATFEGSTDGVWPFSYDECVPDSSEDCETSQCHSQRISACDDKPGHGLNPRQGRGSPEVDILEAIPGNPRTTGAHNVFACYPDNCTNGDCSEAKSERLIRHYAVELEDKDLVGYLQMPRPQLIGSYQVAPGIPQRTFERPKDACMPQPEDKELGLPAEWYPWNFDTKLQRFWYVGATPPDPGIVVMPTYTFWGSNLTKDPTVSVGGVGPNSMQGFEGGGDHPFWVQTDSFSASTQLTASKWAGQHVYAIEWRSTDEGDGYMRWMIDGAMYFELPEKLLSTPRYVHFENASKHHKKGGWFGKGRMLPREPMYIILNVDMSPNWGWPEWYRCNLESDTPGACTDCCMDCTDPKCTTCIVDTSFTTPRNEYREPSSSKHPFVEVNAFEWFGETCEKIPDLDGDPKMGVDSGLLDLSYQVEYVRVYQPEGNVDVGCDPAGFPTAQWIDDHVQDYTPPGMEKPIKSVVPGGGVCVYDHECAGVVTPGVSTPRGTCKKISPGWHLPVVNEHRGTCRCYDGWVGPYCKSQSAGIAAKCALFEEAHVRAVAEAVEGITCHPPDEYNRTMLQHVIDAICTAAGIPDIPGYGYLTGKLDGARLEKACAEIDKRGGDHFSCSEPAKAAALTTTLYYASGLCCNAVTLGSKEDGSPSRSLDCYGSAYSPDDETLPPGTSWLSITGGGALLLGLVGIAMYVKRRWIDKSLGPASDDYHAMPRSSGTEM